MKYRSSDSGRVDLQLTHKLQTETDFWINVLSRVCSVVKSSGNNGNFIMAMKLIAQV